MRARPWSAILLAFGLTLVAGCAGRGIDCPDEYGQEFEDAYRSAMAELEEQGVELTDSDGDCWADIAERQIGTDPESYDSHPSLDQVQSFVDNNTAPPAPPAPPMVWTTEQFDGNLQTVPQIAFAATGAHPSFDMPEGALEAYINVTIQGTSPNNEFTLGVHDEDGDDQGSITTSGGEGSLHVEEPPAGEWGAWVYSTLTPDQGSYTITVTALVPATAIAAPVEGE